MQNIRIEATELDAQSAVMLPDRETLCYAGCVDFQLNLATITSVQTPVAISWGGDANAAANAWIASNQGNWYYR